MIRNRRTPVAAKDASPGVLVRDAALPAVLHQHGGAFGSTLNGAQLGTGRGRPDLGDGDLD